MTTAANKTQKIQALGSPDQETNRALQDFSAPSDQVHHTGRTVPQTRTRKLHTRHMFPPPKYTSILEHYQVMQS